jgi:hypothetical protein
MGRGLRYWASSGRECAGRFGLLIVSCQGMSLVAVSERKSGYEYWFCERGCASSECGCDVVVNVVVRPRQVSSPRVVLRDEEEG